MSYSVNEIIGRRMNDKGQKEYLVSWVGYPIEQSTWEPLRNLKYVKSLLKEFDRKHQDNTEGAGKRKKRRAMKIEAPSESFSQEVRSEKQEKEVKIEKVSVESESATEKLTRDIAAESEETGSMDEQLTVIGMCRDFNQQFIYLVRSSFGLQSYKTRQYMVKNHSESLISFYESKISFVDYPQQ